MAKLEAKNLRISFRTNNGAVRAVRDISFNLEQGETLAIVGESGSGKSVTARAIMGILAGNAIVDGGEIIYDGKDLLKISEDDFHTLRGHKLAMVFQDPLSALNPIMKTGKQLTEAMLLNNRERRRDGRARFNATLKLLETRINQAYGAQGNSEKISAKIKQFDAFVRVAVKLESAYEDARESVVEMLDRLDEMKNAVMNENERALRDLAARLHKLDAPVRNAYVVPLDDHAFTQALEETVRHAKAFTAGQETLSAAIERLEDYLRGVLDKPEPNFFCIGYSVEKGITPDPANDSVENINGAARAKLDREFLLDFLKDVSLALDYAHKLSIKEKQEAIAVLEEALPVFSAEKPDKAACTAIAKRAAKEVEETIDHLALRKDNLSYIFRTTINAAIERYFDGLKRNPREAERFERDTKKHDALVRKDKVAPSVVPMNLVDLDDAKATMVKTVSELLALYRAQVRQDETPDFATLAVELVDYLKARASEYAYHLSKAMAKHRAIELMNEVGISEPQKRYRQYPFELSGGMRQRIVIAIALSANPDILICDEPTTALDVTIQAQILELINRLKLRRNLSVIFITHDLGVVANMADRIAVMYAGKIVEYGTADDVFYAPAHPYTWALLSSMPDMETRERLEVIPGTPPNMILPPKGDAFAPRNHYALQIDFEQQPPMFRVSDSHYAATWLLHPDAPKVEPPAIVRERIARMQALQAVTNDAKGGEPT